ncbi:MAG: SDR family NAD(P)-dependent oxidoreductase, partial [Mariprofundaceae bacterium]|nr:SDR family NAD(P)-dependent oxidoreductase [Mariprofundaceae bacterium]
MKSQWNDTEAAAFSDPLNLRVYASRLLGREPSLVLHGGGNTSVKATARDVFGEEIETLYVKGSGWDLATIEAAGFAPVKLDVLRCMAELEALSDMDMVRAQRMAMLDSSAPNPSVEAILHALIPFKYVDHTHADAVVTITNTPEGESRIRELYGDKVLVIPYVMPGFVLAKTIHELTLNVDWDQLEGMVLLHHGVFTFADDARTSYEYMIRLVSEAEAYLETHAQVQTVSAAAREDLTGLARLRRAVCGVRGESMVARSDAGDEAVSFSLDAAAVKDVQVGTLTPDHVIRIKPAPLVVGDDADAAVDTFAGNYRAYFGRHTDATLTCLDAAPRWAVWPGHGCVSFGRNVKEAGIVADIAAHTRSAVLHAEVMGGWTPVTRKDLFDIEYWELEQAKLKKGGGALLHQGKVALVTGAASGIGKACVETLCEQGAAVVALDINPLVNEMFNTDGCMGLVCDVTDGRGLKGAVDDTVRRFGGLDMVISNAGIFPPSSPLAEMDMETWDK